MNLQSNNPVPEDHDIGWEYLYLACCLNADLGEVDEEYQRLLQLSRSASVIVIEDPQTDLRMQLDNY